MSARRIRRLVLGLVFALIVEYLVLPEVAGARKALHLLGDASTSSSSSAWRWRSAPSSPTCG